MKRNKLLAVLLSLMLGAGVAGFAVGCGKTETPPPDDSKTEQPPEGDDKPSEEKSAPTSITVTNAAAIKPGAYDVTVSVLPEGADASFTSSLVGSHTLVSLVDNEIAVSEEIDDGYEFTVEVVSVKDPSVKATFTFTVDNRPAEGLFIKTLQRTVDAQQNGGALQLTHTMFPAVNEEEGDTPVTYSIEEATDGNGYLGVSITADGLITLDPAVDNRIVFTVKATANVGGKDYSDSITMTVKNEIEREISSEAELRAIWGGADDASVRRLNNFYVLTDNIALTSAWKAIGDDTHSFEGSFNGNGYTISNFNMNAGWNSGFIYRVGEDGVVENLTLESGTGSGEGLSGLFAGPFAGYLLGTIRNCIANVQVTSSPNSAGVYQPIATFVGTLDVTGKILNCVSLGRAIVDKSASDAVQDDTRQSGFIASYMGSALEQNMLNCFALEGSCTYAIGYHTSSAVDPENFFKTEAQLKSAATYVSYDEKTGVGFDRDVWRIVDGSLPLLKNDQFVEPAFIGVTFGGEDISEADAKTVRHGGYAVVAAVEGANGEAEAPQAISVMVTAENGVAEDAFVYADGKLNVDATKAKNGDVCTVTVASAYNPAVKVTFTLTFEAQLAVIASLPAEVEYTADGRNAIDLNTEEFVTVLSGSANTQLTFALTEQVAGVTLTEAGELTLGADCDNTATFTVKITATDGNAEPAEATATIAIKNLVAKQISTADQFLNIWTGDNELSRIHMHNNYVLMNDIDLGGSAKRIGIPYDGSEAYPAGYGLFGSFNGNGHTIRWTNVLSVGWHGGLFAKVEEGGVIKNLALEGALSGAIAGAIGYVMGTVENCYFDVTVSATSGGQHYGNAVAELGAGGVIRNVIAVGAVTGLTTGHSSLFGKTLGTTATAKGTVENCYALEGSVMDASSTDKANTVETNLALKTEAELKTAANFAGWDTDIWYIADGVIPMLKYEGFVPPQVIVPESISCVITNALGGEVLAQNGVYTVSAGIYTFTASVLPANAPQGWTMSAILGYTGAEGGVVAENGNGFRVTADAATGDTFTIEIVSNADPSVKITLSFTVNADGISVDWKDGVPDVVTYTAGGANSVDFADYIDVSGANGYTVSVTVSGQSAGVSAEGSVVTVGAESDNTAAFTVTVTVSNNANASDVAFTEARTVTVVNEVFKEISTAEQFLNIWTDDNELSRLHMHNNYRLTADINLGGNAVFVGKSEYVSGQGYVGYGLFGTFDGNGYKIEWTNTVGATSTWNTGFFARIEKGAKLVNLELKGKVLGTSVGAVGWLGGTLENCYFDVEVVAYGSQNYTGYGSAVTIVGSGAVIKNVVAVGKVIQYSDNTQLSATGGFVGCLAGGSFDAISGSYLLSGTTAQLSGQSNPDSIAGLAVVAAVNAETCTALSTDVWSFEAGNMLKNGCSVR